MTATLSPTGVCEDDGDQAGLGVSRGGDHLHFSITPLIGFLGLTVPPQNIPEGHHNFSPMCPLSVSRTW